MKNQQHIYKKVTAIALSVVLMLATLWSVSNLFVLKADAEGVVSATISYTAQYDGAFQGVKINTSITSDTAENMGYDDAVAEGDGVSLLDVWVQIHKDL